MSYAVICVQRENGGWRALLSWTTGFLWWRRTHRREAFSQSGIVWEWSGGTPGYVDGATCRPPLEAVVSRLVRSDGHSWEAQS